MKSPVFALVDCNNFFVSCVRAFRPDLEGKPVVALSSNDGCVVARSNEAKALGIPMGAPAFKYRQIFKDHGVIQFSGNFELYGDMSRRVTSILTTVTPHVEIYSVDESFLDLSELPITDYKAWGEQLRNSVLQWTGIPVSIGIAGSKTLAKIGTERAKKDPALNGVCDLYSLNALKRQPYLQAVPIRDVWGVGWRLAPQLQSMGITTAAELCNTSPQLAKQLMGIHGRQMVTELNGTACWQLETTHKPQKSLANTRTFGEDTNQLHVLESAIAVFAAKTSFRLRQEKQLAKRAGLFIATNRHKPGYTMQVQDITLPMPTADTGYITSVLIHELGRMFNPRYAYHRAGVWLHDFIPENALQIDLLGTISPPGHDASVRRMQALDSINTRYGKRTMYMAGEDLGSSWQPIRKSQLPRYTTRWEELPSVKPC